MIPNSPKLVVFWYIAAATVIGISGALNLHFPFVADQVVALIAAKTLQSGGTLYVDFWDNKMPGLFWFYWAAGELFGYSEFGVHLLELLWMACFSIVLMTGLRSYFFHSWLSSVAAIAVVGIYFVAAESFQLTQLEILIGLPAFLSAWLAIRARSTTKKIIVYGFLSGVFAGITVCFKLVLAPLFVFFWLVSTVALLHERSSELVKRLFLIWGAVTVGVVLVIVAVVVKFYLDGALKELYWTAFVYPPAALQSSPPAPLYRLLSSATYFASYYATWSLFIVVALLHWWRSDRRNYLTTMMVGWLVVGSVLILIQKFSWWAYHFYILFPPAGILGVRGLDLAAKYLHSAAPSIRIRPMVWTLLLLIPCVGSMLVPASQKAFGYVQVFLRQDGDVNLFHEIVNPSYAKIRKSIRFLDDSEARRGDIYVFGDPLYYYLSGRKPAAPIIGWPWEFFLHQQLRELPRQLGESRPPYLYIDVRNAEKLNARQAGVPQFVGTHYTELFTDYGGTWYGAKPRSWPE